MEAEEIYKLVISSLRKLKYKFDEDILQDIVTEVAISLNYYNKEKGSISNYIYMLTKNIYLTIKTKEKAQKRIPIDSIVSLHNNLISCNEDKLTYLDVIPSNEFDGDRNLNKKIFFTMINPLIREPLRLWLNGYTQIAIAEKLDFKNQTQVSLEINKNIAEIKEYCRKEGITNYND